MMALEAHASPRPRWVPAGRRTCLAQHFQGQAGPCLPSILRPGTLRLPPGPQGRGPLGNLHPPPRPASAPGLRGPAPQRSAADLGQAGQGLGSCATQGRRQWTPAAEAGHPGARACPRAEASPAPAWLCLPHPSEAHLLSWTPLAGCATSGSPTGVGSPSPAAPWPPGPQGQCRLQPPARPAAAGLPSRTAASCHGGAQRRVRARLPSTGGRGAGPGGHRPAHQATAPRQSQGEASEHHEVSRWHGPGCTGPAQPSPVTRGDHSPSPTAIPSLPFRPHVVPLTSSHAGLPHSCRAQGHVGRGHPQQGLLLLPLAPG